MEEDIEGVKISELPQASAVGDNDVVAGVVNGKTSKIPVPLFKGPQGEPGPEGKPGPQGEPGPAGQDGVSPTVTATESDGELEISITDKDGTKKTYINALTDSEKTKLDGLANIKKIGANLSLSEDGELSSTGGGGGSTPPVVQETGTSTTSVMSQKAVTDTINNTSNAINSNVAQNTTAINNEVTAREKAVSDLQAQVQTDLANYYTKSETYTQAEINEMVSAIPKFAIEPVDSLPTENISATTVYLVKSGDDETNLYTEYIYVDSKWEQLGTQTVDLTGYLTVATAAATYVPLTRKINGQPLSEDVNLDIPEATEVVQALGESTTAVMSQKAVNDTVGDIQTVLESI